MRIESFLARDLGIGMVILHIVIVYDDGKRASHYLLIDNRHNLPFRKDTDQLLYLFMRPKDITSV